MRPSAVATAASLGALVALVAPAALAGPDLEPGAARAISPERIAREVGWLSRDALDGRQAGKPGGRAAGDWLAARMAEIGLAPAGDDGTYFQAVSEGSPEGARNVLGAIPGRISGEEVVIGAHYDHVGHPGGPVHNGADDNASGVAAVLEVARAFRAGGRRPRRTVVFALFDAEEVGKGGSARYVEGGVDAVFMLNLDMVGRLGSRLIVFGAGTSPGHPARLERASAFAGLRLQTHRALNPRSDSSAFYRAGVPVLYLFTGVHADYHGPGDDAERVNVPGVARVARLSYALVRQVADEEAIPGFAEAESTGHFPLTTAVGDPLTVEGRIATYADPIRIQSDVGSVVLEVPPGLDGTLLEALDPPRAEARITGILVADSAEEGRRLRLTRVEVPEAGRRIEERTLRGAVDGPARELAAADGRWRLDVVPDHPVLESDGREVRLRGWVDSGRRTVIHVLDVAAPEDHAAAGLADALGPLGRRGR